VSSTLTDSTRNFMRIVAYTLCWNEEKMLPFYLRHYEKFCDSIIIYDNISTDSSVELAQKHPKVEVRKYGTTEIDERAYLKIKNNAYKEERGKSDFVIVGDMDEFLYAPDIMRLFEKAKRQRSAIICTDGYEMVGDKFPVDDGRQIWEIVDTGVQSGVFSKRICFSPEIDICFTAGCHHCNPRGKNVKVSSVHASMLHYRWLGVEYVMERYSVYRQRLSEYNRLHKYCDEYNRDKDEVKKIYKSKSSMAVKVVGV
jgi:glycosyltransferase involved in cell wall biosynthesis